MEFTEFRRLLGAEPRSQDPSFLLARESSTEFRAAAIEAERFEEKLQRALELTAPGDLPELLHAIPRSAPGTRWQRRDWRFAAAAALLITVGAAGLTWRMNTGWDSVEDYVADHFHHDGPAMLAMAAGKPLPVDVDAVLAEFGMTASPALAGIVSVIKTCPTPDGKGVHMVLDTDQGLVTVIYMPDTPVADGEHVRFNDHDAVLVALRSGSAAIIGSKSQQVALLDSLIREALVPGGKSS